MEKGPPPSYNETFPHSEIEEELLPPTNFQLGQGGGGPLPDGAQGQYVDMNNVEQVFKAVKTIDIVSVPVMTQLLSDPSVSHSDLDITQRKKEYLVLDQENGKELLHGLRIPSSDPNTRGITLVLANNQRSLISCGYLYSRSFTNLEFSSPTGLPLGIFQRERFGIGLLCPCLCLFCCCPVATASVRSPTGERILVGDAYLFPRKIDLLRPQHLGGTKVGSINVLRMLPDHRVKVTLEDYASTNEKMLIIGIGVGMMDYERHL